MSGAGRGRGRGEGDGLPRGHPQASTASDTRVIHAALRRGVRMELVVAPISLLLVAVVSYGFIALGLEQDLPHYVALGLVILVSNLVFGLLMVRTALRFLRETRSLHIVIQRRPRAPAGGTPPEGGAGGGGRGGEPAGREKP